MVSKNPTGPWSLAQYPAHLGADAGVVVQPEFSGDRAWYQAYGERHEAEGPQGRLVTQHSFSENWDSWEMHPNGTELVLVTEGECTLVQDDGGRKRRVRLRAGEYAINPPGVWHTADAEAPVTALFITSGLGTKHRPR
jgi:mannose-6-phosphate isomerase-like protein (cupin superfamily)